MLPFLFVISYLCWPFVLQGSAVLVFVLWLCFLVGFLALAVYDLRWFLLPDKIVFPLASLAVAQVIAVAIWDKDWHVCVGALAGTLAISGLFYLIFQFSKGTWIGGGDVKLGLVLGPLAGGLLEGFLVLFIASLIGVIFALPMIVKGKAHAKTPLPFGPLLIAGLIVVKLFGAGIINWYTGLFYA
jgi:prepilin signal peptidase PulO-like enzyme (type II secretory pathway)